MVVAASCLTIGSNHPPATENRRDAEARRNKDPLPGFGGWDTGVFGCYVGDMRLSLSSHKLLGHGGTEDTESLVKDGEYWQLPSCLC